MRSVSGSVGDALRPKRWLPALFALILLVGSGYSPSYAQDIRIAPATRVSPALYCGSVVLTLYTQNAGNPATEFRAGDYNAGQNGQRYFIDPEIGGTIQGIWYEPIEEAANLAMFRILNVQPSPSNNHVFILELLAEQDVGPGRLTIRVHFACRPEAG
jgi:hypothetical protein